MITIVMFGKCGGIFHTPPPQRKMYSQEEEEEVK
jgi:hypothetical protein